MAVYFQLLPYEFPPFLSLNSERTKLIRLSTNS
nr:MAG TPA: hypothetical protein [Caudoviricetes sp.]